MDKALAQQKNLSYAESHLPDGCVTLLSTHPTHRKVVGQKGQTGEGLKVTLSFPTPCVVQAYLHRPNSTDLKGIALDETICQVQKDINKLLNKQTNLSFTL